MYAFLIWKWENSPLCI